MNENIYNNKLEVVLDRLLSIIESKGVNSEEVREFSTQNPDFKSDIEDYCTIWSELENVPSASPSAGMDAAFYRMLSEQTSLLNVEKSNLSIIEKLTTWISSAVKDVRTWVLLGALVTAFSIGWYSRPVQLNSEVERIPSSESESTMQFASLEGASAFEKMEQIQKTKEVTDPNDVVLDMLRRRLIFDESVSVRLSALEVLMKFANQPKVRGYLIESIPHQTEPIVIVELAELMNQLDEKDSAQEWKQLLESDWMETDVRLQIEDKLATIL